MINTSIDIQGQLVNQYNLNTSTNIPAMIDTETDPSATTTNNTVIISVVFIILE